MLPPCWSIEATIPATPAGRVSVGDEVGGNAGPGLAALEPGTVGVVLGTFPTFGWGVLDEPCDVSSGGDEPGVSLPDGFSGVTIGRGVDCVGVSVGTKPVGPVPAGVDVGMIGCVTDGKVVDTASAVLVAALLTVLPFGLVDDFAVACTAPATVRWHSI